MTDNSLSGRARVRYTADKARLTQALQRCHTCYTVARRYEVRVLVRCARRPPHYALTLPSIQHHPAQLANQGAATDQVKHTAALGYSQV